MTTTGAARQRAFNPKVPFTRSQARAAGLTDDVLGTRAYQRLFFNTYLCSTVPATTAVRAAAAIKKVGTKAYASHHTAAGLWGIPVPEDGRIHVTIARGDGRSQCRGSVTHRPLSQSESDARREGVRVSTPDQIFCELASAGVGLVDLVVAGDAMLKAKLATRESLEKHVKSMRGCGRRVARRALGYVRSGVDSPMESRLRMLLVLAGLPEPEVNYILRRFAGEWGRRFDMWYPELKLIIEYDGTQHGELEQRDSDIHRREELERLGYRLVSVTSRGIYHDPSRTLRSVADAIRERGGYAPNRFQPEWRQHFVARV